MDKLYRLAFVGVVILLLSGCECYNPTTEDYCGDPSNAYEFKPLALPLQTPEAIARLAAWGIPDWSGPGTHHNGIDLILQNGIATTEIVSPTAGTVQSITQSKNPFSDPVDQLIYQIDILINQEWTVSLVIEPGTVAGSQAALDQQAAIWVGIGSELRVGSRVATLIAGELGYAHLHYMVLQNGQDVCAYTHSSEEAKQELELIAEKTDSKICIE